jgi:hypothetical protein
MAKKNDKDKINRDKIEEEYGLSWALFQAFPELKHLLTKATGANWSASKFQVELRQTDWFKKHSDIWRQNIALKYSDPTTFKERLGNSRTMVDNLAGAYGAHLTNEASHRLAERALLFGWSEDQIRDVLANHVRPSQAGHYAGQLAPVEQSLRNIALRNGIKLERQQMKNWMRNIVRGNSSQEQYETHIRDMAAHTFQAYGDQIRGGMDLADIASPYINTMAETLELNPASIDLYDKTIRRALSHRNDKGDAVPLSISDFEDQLRADKRWQYTQSAHDQMTEYAVNLGKMFGVL